MPALSQSLISLFGPPNESSFCIPLTGLLFVQPLYFFFDLLNQLLLRGQVEPVLADDDGPVVFREAYFYGCIILVSVGQDTDKGVIKFILSTL